MKKINVDLDTELWSTEITWEDAMSAFPAEAREVFMELDIDSQIELMDEFEHSIKKGIQAGLMNEWDYVLRTALEGSGIYDALYDMSDTKIKARSIEDALYMWCEKKNGPISDFGTELDPNDESVVVCYSFEVLGDNEVPITHSIQPEGGDDYSYWYKECSLEDDEEPWYFLDDMTITEEDGVYYIQMNGTVNQLDHHSKRR